MNDDQPPTGDDSPASDASADVAQLLENLKDLIRRLHLVDVRIQQIHAQTHGEPPFDVDSVAVALDPPEVRASPDALACRFLQHVRLVDETGAELVTVDLGLVVQFTVDDGPEPDAAVLEAFVDRNAYFIAHPYLRQALQDTTARLGVEPVLLGVLTREEDRPTEVTLIPVRSSS